MGTQRLGTRKSVYLQQDQESLGDKGHTGPDPFPFEVQHYQNLSRRNETSLAKQCCIIKKKKKKNEEILL